jgi:hypothetical protein
MFDDRRWICGSVWMMWLAAGNASADSLRAYVDPQTGQLTSQPSAEVQAEVRKAQEQGVQPQGSRPPLREEVLPDGTVKMDLHGRFNQDLVMDRQGDGTYSTHH